MKLLSFKYIFIVSAVIAAFSEDLLRRILPGNPIWPLILKTVFLFLHVLTSHMTFLPRKYFGLFKFWFVSMSIILFLYVFFLDSLIRILISFNALIFIPALCLIAVFKLNYVERLELNRLFFIFAMIAAIFALYTYSSGAYETLGHLFGPSDETVGFRYFEGSRFYFNAGWFFGAERLAWMSAVGISVGFYFIYQQKSLINQIFLLFCTIVLLFSAFTTARATGFVMCALIFLICSAKIFIKKPVWFYIVILIALSIYIFVEEFKSPLDQFTGTRHSFYIEHISTLSSRLNFHIENIKRGIILGGILGLGPLPQGLQYFLPTQLSSYMYPTEGLISHSIAQFGFFSIFHIGFNFWLIYLAFWGLLHYSDCRFPIAVLLLFLKLWLLKASQMETDTFAQFTLYFISTPLIISVIRDRSYKKRIMKTPYVNS